MFVSIPPQSTLNSLEDLLSVVANPDLAKQRVKDLRDSAAQYQKSVDDSGSTLKELQAKEEDLASREQALVDKEKYLNDLQVSLAAQKSSVVSSFADINVRIAQLDQAQSMFDVEMSETRAKYKAREQAVTDREVAVSVSQKQYQDLLSTVKQQQADLEDKLAKLRSITAWAIRYDLTKAT